MSDRFSRLCVFCGSREGTREAYSKGAKELGALLVSRGIALVYGGGSIGMMGTIAETVLAEGGRVTGVIPEALAHREIAHSGVQEMLVVDTMHTRKAKMAELSDGFIGMPGGLGTYEELFEVLTWSQLGIHAKPIGLLNLEGYFTPMIKMIEHGIQEGFIHETYRDLLVSAETPEALLAAMEAHKSPKPVLTLMGLDQT